MKIMLITATSLACLVSATTLAADAAAGAKKAEICFGCHGPEGNSDIPAHPNLAGQQAIYLANQLTAFRSNTRSNTLMNGIAKDLGDADIQNLAAYFAGRKTKSAGGDSSLAKQGAGKVDQCFGCHAEGGKGNGAFPKLAGQQPEYLGNQLHNFKSGQRKNGPMNAITSNLSDSDIAQLSAYLGGLK